MAPAAGVVLAAGAGTRMGRPKADIRLGGTRLLDRAVQVLLGGGCDPIHAVVRAGTAVRGATAIVNPDPSRGMRSSLDLAAAACSAADAMAVVLVDMPGVQADAVRAVVAAWMPGRITVGAYPDGGRGHPIVMSPSFWVDAAAAAGPDEGARAFLRRHADLVDAVPVIGSLADLDTEAELAGWSDPSNPSDP